MDKQNKLNKNRLAILLLTLLALSGCQTTAVNLAGSAAEIDREVDYALRKLYDGTPAARALAAEAKGVLVFPNIVKAGLMVGGQYGRGGALRVNGRTVGYYNSVAASYGWQAGVQSYSYALFLMNDAAVSYLERSEGWEIGVGPTIVIVDAGLAAALTTTTAKGNVYAFIFDQKGLMVGISLEGTKITRIYPDY